MRGKNNDNSNTNASEIKSNTSKIMIAILNVLRSIAKIFFIILEKSLSLLASLSAKGALIVHELPRKIRRNSVFQLVRIEQLSGFSKIAETTGGIEDIILPKIVGLSNGGYLSVNMPGNYLCKINNVSFLPFSDFIRDNNGRAANEKLLRKEYDVLIPRDQDIVEIKGKSIRLADRKNKVYSKCAFNLMGVYSFHWAHFLAQYYPKLSFLNNLPNSKKIDLIIPHNIDSHIKYLIEYELRNHPNIKILQVDLKSEIVCEELYHVSLGTFLGDEAYFPTPFAILISNSTVAFLVGRSLALVPKNVKQFRKLFIGRTGGRSLKNYNEVLEYFSDNGFEEIFPHLLSIEDKIRIFSEAKYIVGPGSSGFANSIFSPPGTKILAFINSFRYLDTYLPRFTEVQKHEFWFMSGDDKNLNDMNSSYEIKISEIQVFLDKENFFDLPLTDNV